jgi:uncharacterized protein (TIGR02099 family)
MNPRRIGKLLLLCAAGLAACVLALMLGLKLVLDRAPEYQAQIKGWVFRQTGYHIAFAHVSPALRWYGPELYFDRFELRSRGDDRVLARAAGGRVGLDLWQFLRSGKLFALRIEVDAPDISVDRLGPSTFAVASDIVLGGERGSLPALTMNDLPAGRLVIRRGTVALRRWNEALPELELREVNLDISRVSDLVGVRLSAQLPPVLGGRLSFSGTALGKGSLERLDWSVLASASGMSFPGWRELLPEYLTRLDAGSGSFRVHAAGRDADLQRAELEFGAQGVVTKLTDGANTKLEQVSGELALVHSEHRWTLVGRRLGVLRDGRRDPNSEFDASWRESEGGMLEFSAAANYLRAEALLPLLGLMPQKDIRDRLREAAPTGEWMDMHLAMSRPTVSARWRFDVRAKFRGVGFAPVGHAPGLRALSGSLAGNETAGHLIIDTRGAVFNWPDQFPEPIGLPVLTSTLYWRRDASGVLVASSNLELRTKDAQVRGKIAWAQPADGSSPTFTMASSIDNGNAADAKLYFPHLLIAPSALQWLDRAFVAGHVSHGDAIFMGPVRQFPFRDGSGLFLVRFRVDHLTLDPSEGWPRIENLAAQGEFRNQGMTVKVASAAAADLKIDSAEARFVDFRNSELEIHATAHGDAADAVGYLAATPLDAMAEGAFSAVEAKGKLEAGLDLFFPFKEFDRRRVLVHVTLDGASLNRKGSSLAATDLSGDADIDGAQVVHADLHGRTLGGAFQMTARAPRSRAATRSHLDFRGVLSGDSLRTALSLPEAVAIEGQTEWRAVLRVAPEPLRERSLKISSNLDGLELDLPEPLSKPAGVAIPVSIDVQWPASGGAQMRVGLGSVLHCAILLDYDANGPRLGRAAVTFGDGEPAFSDTQVVNIGGSIQELDLDGWLKLGGAAKSSKPLAAYFRTAKVTVGRVDFLGLAFLDVTLGIAENGGSWRIRADGPDIAGTITLPGSEAPSEAWDLEFERLKFVDALRPGLEEGEDTAKRAADGRYLEDTARTAADVRYLDDPRSIPPITFHAAELSWGDRQLGEVRASLAKLEDGIRLTRLTATSALWAANATGEWRGKDPGNARIEGTISSTDVGETLKQTGFDAVIEAKSGHLDFNMSWMGAPGAGSLAAATGHIKVALDKGQIAGLKPGAGRVFGLASVAELPRRLALDFSDLTDKGFAFDTVRGDFELRDGSAYTDDVLVKGPAAEIGLIGRVGLKSHDYDQTAVVTGNVSSTLPLAAFAAGPVVGGAVLLFTQVFKQPLKGLVRGYYRITGSWDNPTVERIKGAEAATATAEAPK